MPGFSMLDCVILVVTNVDKSEEEEYNIGYNAIARRGLGFS